MFIWCSSLLDSSGKGHEYLLKYLLGAQNAALDNETDKKAFKVKWREGAEGKVDLLCNA